MILLWTHLASHDDVVDGDMDQFHEESNESHDTETNSGCHGNLLELFPVGLCAALHQSAGIFVELLSRL